MAQWLVMQGDTKTPVGSFEEIEAMARRGALRSGDMIQPPGTTDWLYATDVPDLKAILDRQVDDDDEPRRSSLTGPIVAAVAGGLALVLVLMIVIGGGIAVYFAGELQGGNASLLGEGGLRYSEMIVTAQGASLLAEPADGARAVAPVAKDSTLELVAKRGSFYRARTPDGAEGWVGIDEVIPMYQLGGSDVKQEFDPLYNPDRYVEVANARWMQMPGERRGELSNVTVFEFMMSNDAKYPMTELKIVAIIKDAQGHELERVEIPIEGVIPPNEATFVGTLGSEIVDENATRRPKKDPNAPPDRVMTTWSFEQLAADDPDLQLRWTSGVEVEMKSAAFANAEIDVLELRAVPDNEAAQVVRRE